LPEVEGDVDWGDGLGISSVDGRRASFRVWFEDRNESVGCGATESDSADARLCNVNDPVCQMTVPLLIQHNPVANATTILKRLLRASELLCKCHMFLAPLNHRLSQPHKNAHPTIGWAFRRTCIFSVAARPTMGSRASLLRPHGFAPYPLRQFAFFTCRDRRSQHFLFLLFLISQWS